MFHFCLLLLMSYHANYNLTWCKPEVRKACSCFTPGHRKAQRVEQCRKIHAGLSPPLLQHHLHRGRRVQRRGKVLWGHSAAPWQEAWRVKGLGFLDLQALGYHLAALCQREQNAFKCPQGSSGGISNTRGDHVNKGKTGQAAAKARATNQGDDAAWAEQ